jgi:PAS domain S-box-containing protein
MILAVSRFRVANDRGDAVRDAFLGRPHLVDSAPGFLGMEVFTDASDPTVFYLVTRWTEEEYFHRWHRSEAHRLSHQWIPKGLKLDAAYTKVVVLDRLASPARPPALEEMAADSAQLLARFLSETAAVHYLAAARDGEIRACNGAFADRLDLEPSQLVGRSVWDVLPAPDSARLRERVVAGERYLGEPLALSFTDGSQGLYTLHCHVDVQPDGFVLIGEPPQRAERLLQEQLFQIGSELAVQARERTDLLARERSARVAAEESRQHVERMLAELRTAQARLARLVDSSLIGVLFANRDRITVANSAFLEMVGYSRDDLEAGRLVWRVMTPPEYASFDDRAIEELTSRGECTPFEKEYWRKDGSRVPILIGAALLQAEPFECVCFVLDVSERKRAEREREEALREAERANRAKDQFLAFVSHELRSPLDAILGWTAVLGRHRDDSTVVLRAIETIRRNARLQAKLIDDLLDISRIVTGRLDMATARVELLPLLEGVLDAIRPTADTKGVGLAAALDPWLGSVVGDPVRLHQAFGNILTNAVKFTPPGGKVEVRALREMDHAVVAIRDSGRGMKPEFLPRVFEPFAQEATAGAGRTDGGLGLGLAIVRHLIEAHAGSVTAHSDGEGLGAEFRVRLPALQEDRVL